MLRSSYYITPGETPLPFVISCKWVQMNGTFFFVSVRSIMLLCLVGHLFLGHPRLSVMEQSRSAVMEDTLNFSVCAC